MKTLFAVARCILHNINRERERDDLSVEPTNLNLTWLHRASKTPLDNPKQNKSRQPGGCWVQSLLFPMRLTNRCLSQIQVEDVFSPLVNATPRKILHGTPKNADFWKMNEDDVPLKNVRWIFFGATAVHFQGVKTVQSWNCSNSWVGGWPCEAKSSSPPVVQLDGMIF